MGPNLPKLDKRARKLDTSAIFLFVSLSVAPKGHSFYFYCIAYKYIYIYIYIYIYFFLLEIEILILPTLSSSGLIKRKPSRVADQCCSFIGCHEAL